jgi:hypothetical protein
LCFISLIEFIAKVAWPVSILVIALVYRRLLNDLLAENVTRLRAGPFELAWDQAKSGVARPRQASEANTRPALVPTDTTEAVYTSLLDTDIGALADSDPREAVLCAYDAVREAFRQGLAEAGVENDANGLDALGLVREAESRGLVPSETTDAVLGLNVLHNLAKHAPMHEMSPSRAYEYLAMADGALYSFATAIKKSRVASPSMAAA